MLIEKSSLRTKNELFSTSFHRENVAINGQRKEGSAAAKNQHFCIAAFLQHFCFCSFNIFNLILKKKLAKYIVKMHSTIFINGFSQIDAFLATF